MVEKEGPKRKQKRGKGTDAIHGPVMHFTEVWVLPKEVHLRLDLSTFDRPEAEVHQSKLAGQGMTCLSGMKGHQGGQLFVGDAARGVGRVATPEEEVAGACAMVYETHVLWDYGTHGPNGCQAEQRLHHSEHRNKRR